MRNFLNYDDFHATPNPRPTQRQLPAYVKKHCVPKYGKIVKVEKFNNMLGYDWFRKYHFASGSWVVFSRDAFNTFMRTKSKITKIVAPIPKD